MTAFHFDPKTHIYRVDNRERESSTQVMVGLGIIDTDIYPELSRIRGVRVHKATVFVERPGGIDWESLKPISEALEEDIEPRVRAWERFLAITGWISRITERPNYHPVYSNCGCVDRIGKFPGDSAESVLDIKTGKPEKWHGWQTGSYEEIERAHDGKRRHRLGVELAADGRYHIHQHEDEKDGSDFLELLSAYRAGRRKGYFKPIPNMESYDI